MRKDQTMSGNSDNKGCLKVFIIFLVIFLGIGIYVVTNVGRFMSQSRKSSINYYCEEAKIPSFASLVDRYEIIDYNGNHNYKSLESRKFKDEKAMCEALPSGFSRAVNYALEKGNTETTKDIDGVSVTRYTVSKNLLPIDKSGPDDGVECYYFVLRYSDGSCRFDIVVEIVDPDY